MELADALCFLLAKEGIHRNAYSEGLPHFSKLSNDHKLKAINHLQFYYDLCMEQVSEGYALKDSPSFTWRALKALGYTPTSDLFEKMKDHHVVEIYSSEGVQVFRSLTFFKHCSYTFEEIHSLEWWTLFDRPAEISQTILDATVKIFTGATKDIFDPGVPAHLVKETQSEERLLNTFKMDWIGPLFHHKRAEAVICLETINLISN